jgi:DNA-binding LacI/PurR family transcriptional regulator
MTKRPSIHDIAKQAGVCIGTVSRVINDKDKVSPKTRQKIQEVIAKTGYRPSAMARGLVLGQTHNILLCLHNIADPYCVSVTKLLGDLARKRGYGLLLGDLNNNPDLEAEYLQWAGDRKVDGLIVSPLPGPRNSHYYAELAKSRFPLVLIDMAVPNVELNCVKYDDVAVGRMAVDYLIGKGHRRIGFVDSLSEFSTVKDRYRGYVEGHSAAGIQVSPAYLLHGPVSWADWHEGTLAPLFQTRKPPTAIVTENEMVGNLCVNMLLRAKKRIPDDMAVVSLGDLLAGTFVPVPMTAVALHHEGAMRRALDLLMELIAQPELRKEPPCQFIQKPELIVRKSA